MQGKYKLLICFIGFLFYIFILLYLFLIQSWPYSQRLKSKLENRRLDYDAKMNKVQKTKKENQTLEEEARVAQAKYEETLGVLWDKMVEIESNEQDQIREVNNLVIQISF